MFPFLKSIGALVFPLFFFSLRKSIEICFQRLLSLSCDCRGLWTTFSRVFSGLAPSPAMNHIHVPNRKAMPSSYKDELLKQSLLLKWWGYKVPSCTSLSGRAEWKVSVGLGRKESPNTRKGSDPVPYDCLGETSSLYYFIHHKVTNYKHTG